MRSGKLTSAELKSAVIDNLNTKSKNVIVSAEISEDSAALKFNGVLLLTTDPITQAGKDAGALAIKVTANDIACSGGEPFAALLTVLAPENASVEDISEAVKSAKVEAAKIGVEIVGGHTEFSSSVNKLVLSCTMLGRAVKIIRSTSINEGDDIIVTKTVGLEGTSILVKDHAEKLKLSKSDIKEAESFFDMISILPEARIARELPISAMHDITEGGIFGAVAEISDATKLGAELYVDKIPLAPLTKKLAESLNVNPFKLISSGSLLIYAHGGAKIAQELNKKGILATVCGRVTGNLPFAVYGNKKERIFVESDEIYRF